MIEFWNRLKAKNWSMFASGAAFMLAFWHLYERQYLEVGIDLFLFLFFLWSNGMYRQEKKWHPYYILESDGKTPIPCDDVVEYSTWMEQATTKVASTIVGPYEIETDFIGLNHQFSLNPDDPPLCFETMVKNDPKKEWTDVQLRYSTWTEAEAGHTALVALIQASIQIKANEN